MMHLDIITPEKKLFSGNIKLIQVPGTKGPFEILRNHAAIVSTLSSGKIKIVTNDDQKSFFDIRQGVVEVKNNKVVVLATV
ncbi:MAG TPA: ATP synthase F1 subunit epsilon [Bacteroidales bacterium]|jgi:F-type H+-transporting ATPase subunit epsilon|nr:ATP synthase F1 subunit epsilon [Bacteroidales bacterium]